MKIRDLKNGVAALALMRLCSLSGRYSACGGRHPAEIRLLKARLKQLEEKVAKQERERKAAAAAPAAAQPGPPIQSSGLAFPRSPKLAMPSPKDRRKSRVILMLAHTALSLAGCPSRPEAS
jgi:hypothetical protein